MKKLIPKYFMFFYILHHVILSYVISKFTYFVTLIRTFIPLPSFSLMAETALSLYFRSLGLSPYTVDLDDQTVMHFWVTNHRRFEKPNLIMVHGYGGNSMWQFFRQVGPLSRSFNLFIPDLLFFGKSYTTRPTRSEGFQAKCVGEGLRRLGVERYTVYGISYGGFVAYRMAETYPEEVERVVIVSSGICVTDEEQKRHLESIGRDPLKILLPETMEDMRYLVKSSMHKYDVLKWIPDFFLRSTLTDMEYRKEKLELLKHLMEEHVKSHCPVLTQETLLIWGNQDKFFPPHMALKLQRHLGPKSKLEIIEDTGHAANMESPHELNELIKPFVLGQSKCNGK